MALIVFFSAKGAPGTTTTALLTAALWPRPALVIDCDPAGGDVALRMPAPDGRPLDVERGLLTLLPLARRSVDPPALLQHAQQVMGGTDIVAGLPGPEQATAAGPGPWLNLAEAFSALYSHDVIVDLGRLDSASPVLPILFAADIALCVTTTNLSHVVATRTRLASLQNALEMRQGERRTSLGFVVRGEQKSEVASAVSALTSQDRLLNYLGHIAEDSRAAAMFDGRPILRPERTVLVRSGREVTENIQRQLSGDTYATSAALASEVVFPVNNWLSSPQTSQADLVSPSAAGKAPGRRRAETHRRSRRS